MADITAILQDPWFIRFLIAILCFIFAFVALQKTPSFAENKLINVVISTIFALLASFYIEDQALKKYVLIPYHDVGLLLVMLLPLFIVLLLVHRLNLTPEIRKTVWLIIACAVGIPWLFTDTVTEKAKSQIYLIFMGLSILALILDRPLHRLLKKK